MEDQVDYLLLGSGISSLSFGALMAKAKRRVRIIEAHETFGGFGHSFQYGEYRFNAQLHYVMSCGDGRWVNVFFKKLGMENEVRFEALDSSGYDRVFSGKSQLKIPYGLENLQRNMTELVPNASQEVSQFIKILQNIQDAVDGFPRHWSQVPKSIPKMGTYLRLLHFYNSTLQEVFDSCNLPILLQTLVGRCPRVS